MHHFCIRAIICALFITFASSAQSLNPSNQNAALPVVEGSGSIPSSNVDKNVVAADIDWEASGVGPDDEDGDVVEGSGAPEVEGSGIPPHVPAGPPVAVKTTTVGVFPVEKTTSTSVVTKPTTASSPPLPIATTVITITTEDTKRQEDIFNAQKPLDDNELKFGGDDGDDDDDDDDDDSEGDDFEPTTQEITTTSRKQTTSTSTTTTRRPPSVAIGTEPPGVVESDDEDAFHNMFKPGILAAITGGAVVGILLAILLVMFIVYRIRKKDEGSYSVDESSHQPHNYSYAYQKAATKEFYA